MTTTAQLVETCNQIQGSTPFSLERHKEHDSPVHWPFLQSFLTWPALHPNAFEQDRCTKQTARPPRWDRPGLCRCHVSRSLEDANRTDLRTERSDATI